MVWKCMDQMADFLWLSQERLGIFSERSKQFVEKEPLRANGWKNGQLSGLSIMFASHDTLRE